MQRTLDAFTGGMALVRNRRWDYLAANALGRAVYAEIFDGRTGPPNHVRYVFLDDRARNFFDDWPAVAHDTARILRSEAGRDPHDPGPAELIEELSQTSAEFRAIWSQHDVRLPAAGLHRFHHPLVGMLDLVFEAAELRADPGLTLLLATAEQGSPTETALRRLAAMTARVEAATARHKLIAGLVRCVASHGPREDAPCRLVRRVGPPSRRGPGLPGPKRRKPRVSGAFERSG